MPWVRAVATKIASPTLASHAENAKINSGEAVRVVIVICSSHNDMAVNRDNIIPSKHSKADSRWYRCRAKPVIPRINADEKVNCEGEIGQLWILTTSF